MGVGAYMWWVWGHVGSVLGRIWGGCGRHMWGYMSIGCDRYVWSGRGGKWGQCYGCGIMWVMCGGCGDMWDGCGSALQTPTVDTASKSLASHHLALSEQTVIYLAWFDLRQDLVTYDLIL